MYAVQEAVRGEHRIVARCWHPEATPGLIDTGNGVMAYLLVGNPAYQVSSGEIVAL